MRRRYQQRAGALRQIVDIEQPPTGSDGMGGITGSWSAFDSNVPAAVDPVSGAEQFGAEQTQFRRTHEVTVRYNPSKVPTTAMRVNFAGRLLYIVAIIDTEERHEWLTLHCEERAED